MDEFKNFIKEYSGAIIGGLIALIILWTRLHELIIGTILISIGAFVGNYIQKNKYDVKEKVKSFIDKV